MSYAQPLCNDLLSDYYTTQQKRMNIWTNAQQTETQNVITADRWKVI